MKSRSRKTIKKSSARKRTDHPAGCRVNDEELGRVSADIARFREGSGIPISLGAYTKHAILDHFRLRKIELGLKALVLEAGKAQDPHGPPSEFIDRLQALLETRP